MSKDLFWILFVLTWLCGCSSNVRQEVKKGLVRPEEVFSYTDKNGQFEMKLSSGFNKKDRSFFTKKSLEIPERSSDGVLEQSVSLSTLGLLKKKQVILRPKHSQFSVWFEGRKFFSEIKLNLATRMMDVRMVSPESQWNGQKQIKLPVKNALYCYFSQIIECAKTVGFLNLATKNETGTMNFFVVWESYPYTSEIYSGLPSELFTRAQLEYDGKTKEGERRFNLKIIGQSIFYILDEADQMKKMFWVSQGISMVSKNVKKLFKASNTPSAIKIEKNTAPIEGDEVE